MHSLVQYICDAVTKWGKISIFWTLLSFTVKWRSTLPFDWSEFFVVRKKKPYHLFTYICNSISVDSEEQKKFNLRHNVFQFEKFLTSKASRIQDTYMKKAPIKRNIRHKDFAFLLSTTFSLLLNHDKLQQILLARDENRTHKSIFLVPLVLFIRWFG